MGYRDQRGIVGQYRGEDVFVIGYKNFKQPAPDDTTIYAVVSDAAHQKLELVRGEQLIGVMTDSGYIEIYDAARRKGYKFYTKEQQPSKPEPEYEIVQPREEPTVRELDVSGGYGEFSRTVDDFFKGLDKLWEELEV